MNEFLDVTDNKIKKCKIYDQYQHLKAGLEFVSKDNSIYHVHLNNNKLEKKVEHNNENWKIDFPRYLNSVILITGNKAIFKLPLYNELYNLYKDHNIPISKKELFFQYYSNVDIVNDKVICSEKKL